MSQELVFQEPISAVPEGEYDATVVDVRRQDATHGKVMRFDFMIDDDEAEGRQVSGMASDRPCENTKLGRWITAILGRTPEVGERVKFDDLHSKKCRVLVKHRKNSEDQVFANVTQVLPAAADSQSD